VRAQRRQNRCDQTRDHVPVEERPTWFAMKQEHDSAVLTKSIIGATLPNPVPERQR